MSCQKSFTLIELLVVIALIGVLSSVVMIAINPAQRMGEARDAQRKLDLAQMRDALEAYAAGHGGLYPTMGWGWCGECDHHWGYPNLPRSGSNGYIPNLAPDWLKLLPTDPKYGGSVYGACYIYLSNGTDYKLLAHNTPDNYPPASENPFFDPRRPTWAWAVWSSDASKNW